MVPPITLHPVETVRDLAAFIALPRRLYRHQPHYVAPLDHERRELLDPRKSSFHTHGESAYWIARRGGEAVGRISAQVDHLATGAMHEAVGFFGCLDALDDGAVVAALLGQAETWLASRGKTRLRGPFLLSINGESGLLIEGQEQPPMVLMPWHPAYLAGHLEAFGYRLAKTLNSYHFASAGSDLAERLARLGVDKRRRGYSIRAMDMRRLEADAEAGRRLFNAAWAGNWGFVPVSEVEMRAMIRAFRPLLRGDFGVFVEKDGEAVGFALFLPNLFEVVGDLGGAPSPLGWLKLLSRTAPWPLRHRFRGGRGVLFGVAAPLVGTVAGAGVALVLVDELARRAVKTNVQDLECGWILDDNYAMTSVVQWLGAKLTRRFGVYESTIGAGFTA
jgi:hypothetical protein